MKDIEKTKHSPLVKLNYDKKIISKSGEFRIYRNAIIFTPGEWTDMFSPSPIYYSEEVVKDNATNWISDILNLDHSRYVLKRLGFVKNYQWKDGAVVGDLYILSKTQNQKDTIALIDAKLINWLSPEFLSIDKWNYEKNMKESTNIQFVGLAVVTEPACDNTQIVEW